MQMQIENASDYATVIAAAGAEFQGVQHGPRSTLILFVDPESGSTLAVAESEFALETVLRRLNELKRREFASLPDRSATLFMIKSTVKYTETIFLGLPSTAPRTLRR